MQTRHRIPSIFNLSMVDVLCCALGCVILLWLVYFKEARERTIAAGQNNKNFIATKLKLDSALLDLTSAQQALLTGKQKNELLGAQLLEITTQRDNVLAKWEKTDRDHQMSLQNLKDAQASISGLRKDINDLETLSATVKSILAQKTKDYSDLTLRLLAATQNIGNLEKMVGDQKGVLELTAAQAAALKAKLADAEKDAGSLAQELANYKNLAKEQAAQLAKIETKAMTLDRELDKRKLDLVELANRYDELLTLKNILEQSLAANRIDLAKSEKATAAAKNDLAKSAVELAAAKNDLAKSVLELAAAKNDLAKNAVDLAAAKSEITKRDLDLISAKNDLVKNALDLAAAKNDLAKSAMDLAAAKSVFTKSASELAAAKNDLAKSAMELAIAKNDLAKSQAELDQFKLTNHGLVGETKILTQEVSKLRAATDNRFAGIELTGSRVIFLVDMSGSMKMKDEKIEDPDKWPLVCEILGKLMKSLPDLKKFQVILFSDKYRYPLSNAGQWQDYHGPVSAKNVMDAVRAEVPQNETNMSSVFEEAFKYRAMGLDTIYLLSDGLPNAGDGLPPGAEKLSYADQSMLLGKYIRDRLKTTWNAPYGRWTKQRVTINAVGFFFDSPDVGAFLWALARDNNGSFVGLSKP